MKKTLILVLALLIGSGSLVVLHAGDAAPAADAAQTITGEVIDMTCFAMDDSSHGPKHASCAVKCLKEGSPAGLLTDDGSVYLLVASHENGPKAMKQAKKLAAKKVSVTGKVAKRNGVNVIIADKVEKAK